MLAQRMFDTAVWFERLRMNEPASGTEALLQRHFASGGTPQTEASADITVQAQIDMVKFCFI